MTAWTFVPNLSIDVPLGPSIAWSFGRIPILEPSSRYTGAGLGLSTVDVDVTDNVPRGDREQFRLGWQVTLEQPGSMDPFCNSTLSRAAHEFDFGVRVNFWEIPYPEKGALRDLR